MDWITDNGILPRIRGDIIARVLNALPRAELAKADTIDVDHDVPDIGRVRFTAQRKRARHHRHSHMFWSATNAVLIDAEAT
jgi:hypothetical protein